MSFLKRLFGGNEGGSGPEGAKQVGEAVEHNGFSIRATPYSEGGQFQTCGLVSREIDGEIKEHRFVRADRFPDIEQAADQAIRKGRQLVDEQGAALFG